MISSSCFSSSDTCHMCPHLIAGGSPAGKSPCRRRDEGRRYFTDSLNPVLRKILIAPDGRLGPPTTVALAGRFRIPTTVAEHGDRLAIVNARFDLGAAAPVGDRRAPGASYDVVLVGKP
jgi:hypothetical protein